MEHLLRTHFLLTQSLLLFEHLLSHSDRPMFLSARKVCEVLGLDRHQLEQCRLLPSSPAALCLLLFPFCHKGGTMSSLDASVYLLVIAYPLLFVVMAVFMGLTYFLRRVFPGD